MRDQLKTLAFVAFALIASMAHAQETLETPIGPIDLESGYPSKESVEKLYDAMDFQGGDHRGDGGHVDRDRIRAQQGQTDRLVSRMPSPGQRQ